MNTATIDNSTSFFEGARGPGHRRTVTAWVVVLASMAVSLGCTTSGTAVDASVAASGGRSDGGHPQAGGGGAAGGVSAGSGVAGHGGGQGGAMAGGSGAAGDATGGRSMTDAGRPSSGGDAGRTGGAGGGPGDAGSTGETLGLWPQAGGPDGTFRVDADDAPSSWSVATHKNILWQTDLDNEGQGEIAVAGDNVFLTTFLPYAGSKTSLSIQGYAIDRKTGAIKWRTKPLTGNGLASGMAYQYSDATSWGPISDGRYVWFFNSAGHLGCWDTQGTPDASGHMPSLWEADFTGQDPSFPYNRQHEPFLAGSNLVILSPLGKGLNDPAPKNAGWNYLHGIDKMTGRTTWVAGDASTFYNTALPGKLADGTLAVLHGRGGPHGVPERPVGLSLTSLAPGNEGKSLWQFNANSGSALYNMSWDDKYAYWFTEPSGESLVVVDATTGKQVHTWSLAKAVDIRRWDAATKKYVTMGGVDVNNTVDWTYGGMMHVVPDWHSNTVARGYVWFVTVTNNNDRWGVHTGPPHCVGRVNVETGKVEYLEVPVGVQRVAGQAEQLIYGKDVMTTAQDAKGNDVADDAQRSHTDGWAAPAFYPPPVLLGTKLYFGTTLGITYVIDATAKVLDESAILGYGDLGPLGQTWSLAAPSYADGVIYHHSSKQVVAISTSAGP